MKHAGLVAALAITSLVACGDDGSSPNVTPDAPANMPDAPVVAWQPGCTEVPQEASAFDEPSDFGAATAGSLATWDPDGRWFYTDTRMGGSSSIHLARNGNNLVTLNRDDRRPGTLDDTHLFYRQAEGSEFVVALRISDLQPDGTLHAYRAVCEGGSCRVCAATLTKATYADPQQSEKLSLLGEFRGANWQGQYTFNVRVAGTLAYLIREDGLHIIETADPANPVEVGSYFRNDGGYSNDLKIVETATKRYVIIADGPVDVVDVTNPAQPVRVAQISEAAHTLYTETRLGKTYAYFGNYDASAPVYDVTDPAHPVKLGSYQVNGFLVHDLSVKDGIAYLNAWNEGMVVVDYTNPDQPKRLGVFPSPTNSSHSSWPTVAGGRPIVLSGDENYGAHLDIVDNDPASPTYMQSLATYKTRDFVSIHNIMGIGEKAYFSYYQDGIRVLDLSNPTQPQLVGYFNTWDPQSPASSSEFFEGAVGLDIDPVRKLVFVADSPRGLIILRDDT